MERQAEALDQFLIPSACPRAEHLHRRRIRVFGDGASGQKKVYQVWNQEQPRRAPGKAFQRVSVELKERIEGHELNARALEDFLARDKGEDLLHCVARSLVSVTDGVFDEHARVVDQTVIDAPAIDAYAFDGPAKLARTLAGTIQARPDLVENLWQLPAQMAPGFASRIAKTSQLFQQQLALVHPRQKHTPASSTEIDRDVERILHRA